MGGGSLRAFPRKAPGKYISSNNYSDIKLSNYDLMRLSIELSNITLFEHELTEQKTVKNCTSMIM